MTSIDDTSGNEPLGTGELSGATAYSAEPPAGGDNVAREGVDGPAGTPDSDPRAGDATLANDAHERTERALDDLDRQADDETANSATPALGSSNDTEVFDDAEGAPGTPPPGAAQTPAPSDEQRDERREDRDGGGDPGEAGHERPGEGGNRLSPEEFAAEHDPANHDIAAGGEFRQAGDWTADDAGGPQVWDAEGTLVTEGENAEQQSTAGAADRRVSQFEEVVDGGYSVGSAAPIHDDAMPLGHPVMAWEDTKTYVTEGHPAYGSAEPHVWFTDDEAAEAAGFRRVD